MSWLTPKQWIVLQWSGYRSQSSRSEPYSDSCYFHLNSLQSCEGLSDNKSEKNPRFHCTEQIRRRGARILISWRNLSCQPYHDSAINLGTLQSNFITKRRKVMDWVTDLISTTLALSRRLADRRDGPFYWNASRHRESNTDTFFRTAPGKSSWLKSGAGTSMQALRASYDDDNAVACQVYLAQRLWCDAEYKALSQNAPEKVNRSAVPRLFFRFRKLCDFCSKQGFAVAGRYSRNTRLHRPSRALPSPGTLSPTRYTPALWCLGAQLAMLYHLSLLQSSSHLTVHLHGI